MAKATSPASGQPYGIQRVCQLWGVPRSSFYAAQAPAPDSATPATSPARRGPRPAISDEALIAAIRRDLARSPWTGGHAASRMIGMLQELANPETALPAGSHRTVQRPPAL